MLEELAVKVLFVVNPVAGKGIAARQVDKIKLAMESMKGVEYSIVYTKKPGHATEIARQGTAEGYEIIFAVGGDGTVNEVVNGLVGRGSALGVIPGGSGNDFIRSLGIEGDTYELVLETIKGVKVPVDIGIINGRYFVNISSVGFDAQVVLEAQKAKSFFLSGSAAYIAGLISAIFRSKPNYVRMNMDNQYVENRALLVAVANGKYYGGGMMAAPEAAIDDGLFDICFISNISRAKMLLLFTQFIRGKHKRFKEVSFYRSRKVSIECKKPIPVNIDGEVFIDTRVDFELVRGGLLVVKPKDS